MPAVFNPQKPHLVRYSDVEGLIQDGWIAQYRGREWISRWIMAASIGVHSHSGMLRRIEGNGHKVDLLDIREDRNGAAVPFEREVEIAGGRIDVFSPDLDRWPEFSGRGAVNYMRVLTGRKYGWGGVFRMAAMRYPIVRNFLTVAVDDCIQTDAAPFCSHAVCSAVRIGGGVDPVPRKPDHLVTPSDLTCSLFYRYEFSPVISL
jgi:hypothetical protein